VNLKRDYKISGTDTTRKKRGEKRRSEVARNRMKKSFQQLLDEEQVLTILVVGIIYKCENF